MRGSDDREEDGKKAEEGEGGKESQGGIKVKYLSRLLSSS